MNKVRFLLLVSILCIGLKPVTAQDVYINSYKNDPDRKHTVYINRNDFHRTKPSQAQKDKARTRYKHKLKIGQDIRDVQEKIKIFHAWENSEWTPRTTEEVLSYASAKRAVNQAVMLKRHKYLVAYLDKKQYNRKKQLARNERKKRNTEFSFKTSKSSSQPRKKATTSQTILKKPSLYIEQGAAPPSKNSVFTGYR